MTDLEKAIAAGGKVIGGSAPSSSLSAPQTDLERALATGGQVLTASASSPAPTQPDHVAPYGLAGVVRGERASEPSRWDRVKAGASAALNAGGSLATNVLDAASAGLYSKAQNAVFNLVSPGAGDQQAATVAEFNAAHPIVANTATGLGYLAPTSEASMLARTAEAGGALIGRALPTAARAVLAARPVTGALAGAVTGGGQAAAEAIQHGASATEAMEAAKDAVKVGAVVGAVGGAAAAGAEKVVGKLKRGAVERELKQSISNIVGGDPKAKRAVATQVAKVGNARNVIREELQSTEGREIADVARLHPEQAQKLVERKLDQVTQERVPDMQTVDRASLRGGVRAGDLVKHLEDAADALEDTGTGDKHVIADLREAAGRVKNAGQWGAKRVTSTVSPETPYDANFTVGQYRQLMAKVGRAEQAEADIAAKFPPKAGAKTFDSDTVVPTIQLRKFVTAMQRQASNSLGTINGTQAYENAQAVARVGKEFLDAHLDAAAKADPNTRAAVERLREMNRRVNALATISDTLENRVKREATASIAVSPTAGLEAGLATAGAVMSHGASIPATAAALAAKKAAPGLIRGADRALTRSLATASGTFRAPPAVLAGAVGAATVRNPEQELERLVARADGGDAQAAAKLAALTQKAPLLAARVTAIRRRGAMP